MIVRTGPHVWLLISQIEHARIAAEIADVWRLPTLLMDLADDFQFAVRHHDDGWAQWDSAPTVNEDGRPRDFMDMPMPVATKIWSASINITVQHSRWAGLWVSRHFCHLAELAIEHRESEADLAAARRFLAMQFVAQRRWRARLGVEPDSLIELLGLHGVQFFDRLSLWLCCAERTQPQEFVDPEDDKTRWTPVSSAEVRIESAAFMAQKLPLAAPATVIPQQLYADDAELRATMAAGQRATLAWTLSAG